MKQSDTIRSAEEMAAEKKETIVPGITVEQEKKIEEKLKQAGGDTLASSTTPLASSLKYSNASDALLKAPASSKASSLV